MFNYKGINIRKYLFQVLLLLCMAFTLTSCGDADCSLQLLAGGSEYCEETASAD